jgi:hypothetical protein
MDSLDFSDLESDFRKDTATDDNREKFPCHLCGGTGTWVSPLGRKSGKCHACQGRGYFLTSPEQRRKAAKSRAKSQHNKLVDAMTEFEVLHPDLIKDLSEVQTWNNFAASLLDQFRRKGSLSDNQVAAAERMFAKMDANKKAKEANRTNITLDRIKQMIKTAVDNGVKRPILRVGDLAISRAPSHGRNMGYLYVKDDGEYAGKISPDGDWMPVGTARPGITAELIEIAKDPFGATVKHGKETGQCSCCGRKLTNPESIRLGIGPICRENWGL